MLAVLIQLVVNGIGIGLVYVTLTAGFVLLLSVTRIFYIAYGALYMIGAYAVWGGISLLNLPFWVSLIIAVVVVALLASATYQFIFRRIKYEKGGVFLSIIIVAIALMMFLDQAAILVFGPSAKGVPPVFPGMVGMAGISISVEKLMLIVLALVIVLALFFVYEKTNIGRAMRAVSFNPDAASLHGVNTGMICLMTFGISGAIAGFAGGIIAPVYGLFPEMGKNITLSILLVAMLGGMDSVVGAVLGGLVYGITLSFGQYFIGGLSQILLFLVTSILIFFRPGGLLGSGAELGI
jgi:branched-chain amino acid transport system permease protein